MGVRSRKRVGFRVLRVSLSNAISGVCEERVRNYSVEEDDR